MELVLFQLGSSKFVHTFENLVCVLSLLRPHHVPWWKVCTCRKQTACCSCCVPPPSTAPTYWHGSAAGRINYIEYHRIQLSKISLSNQIPLSYVHLSLCSISPSFANSKAMSMRSKDPDVLNKGKVVFQRLTFPLQSKQSQCQCRTISFIFCSFVFSSQIKITSYTLV